MKKALYFMGMLAILLGGVGGGRLACAALVVIDDQYTGTNPSTGTSVNAPNTFTSSAVVGGNITYTVNAGAIGVGFAPFLNFFGGALTVSDMFMTLITIPGNLYEVDFTTLQVGAPTTHTINVSALDGTGVGGILLGSSGAVGINSAGNFTFTPTTATTTIRMLGILGSPNSSSDIGFDNFQVSTAIPEPTSFVLLGTGVGVLGLGVMRRRRQKNCIPSGT
ncbi:MAG: PEP-CTERM sorting domain-containing protein [Thiohalocapsa sp. PB-PSB1]|jgi:hypothetical protein|nr:MAG: PEP-CTERM sorting domain-containing protein [Thiohalocapsa sp. PB-PSB1]